MSTSWGDSQPQRNLSTYRYCIVKNLVIASILAPAALGYGMAAAAIHSLAQPAPPAAECGTPGEDPIRCSREGAQAVSLLLAGSRDEFPEKRCGGGGGPVRCT